MRCITPFTSKISCKKFRLYVLKITQGMDHSLFPWNNLLQNEMRFVICFFWRLGRMIFAVRIQMATERRTVKNSVIRIVSGRPIVCPNLPSASPIPVNYLELYPVGIEFCHNFPIVHKIQNSNLHVFKRSQYHNLFNIYFSGVCEPLNDPKCAGKNDFLQCDSTPSCNMEGGTEFEMGWCYFLFKNCLKECCCCNVLWCISMCRYLRWTNVELLSYTFGQLADSDKGKFTQTVLIHI